MISLLRVMAFVGIAASVVTPLVAGAVLLSLWNEAGHLPDNVTWHWTGLAVLCALSGGLSWLALRLSKIKAAG